MDYGLAGKIQDMHAMRNDYTVKKASVYGAACMNKKSVIFPTDNSLTNRLLTADKNAY